jgi:hypothetical protein
MTRNTLLVIPSRADGKREPALSETNVDLSYAGSDTQTSMSLQMPVGDPSTALRMTGFGVGAEMSDEFKTPPVVSSEVETSLIVLRTTVRDSSTPLGMTEIK